MAPWFWLKAQRRDDIQGKTDVIVLKGVTGWSDYADGRTRFKGSRKPLLVLAAASDRVGGWADCFVIRVTQGRNRRRSAQHPGANDSSDKCTSLHGYASFATMAG